MRLYVHACIIVETLSLSLAIVLTHSNAYSADGMPRPIKHESWSADVVKEGSSTLPKNARREEEMTDDSIIVVGGHAATIVAVFVVVVVPSPSSSTTTHAGAEEADDMFDESMIVVLGPLNSEFLGGNGAAGRWGVEILRQDPRTPEKL
jgi:hypothetical protein